MKDEPSPSLAWVPPDADYEELVVASRACQACSLYKRASRTVFGEGRTDAPLMLVGEQPGDREDIEGRPFVGPAGKLLDKLLAEAGMARDDVYVTNAVKHFKWELRGKRRLHSKPKWVEVHACRGWLESEIELVQPEVIVCMGATAAQALRGSSYRMTASRGKLEDGAPWAPHLLATFHPSALLRARSLRDEVEYHRMRELFLEDIATAASVVPRGHRTAKRAASRAPAH